jgi:hypothetical protein
LGPWSALLLVGLVTAIATGIVDAVFAKRRDDGLAKIGAKVVAGQIGLADSQSSEAEREGLWWRFYGVPISSWPDYQGVLVARLPEEDLETVAQAVAVMELLWQSMRFAPEFTEDPRLGSVALDTAKHAPFASKRREHITLSHVWVGWIKRARSSPIPIR